MVNTYEEWVQACRNEHKKLLKTAPYLNDEGLNRKAVFGRLVEMSEFCSSAKEFVAQIDARDSLSEEDIAVIDDKNAVAPIRSIRKIAEEELKVKQTFYVTYAFTAHFVAAVEAFNYKEALKKAEGRYLDADFGEAQDIDGAPIIVEDEDGNYVWEERSEI